MKKLLVSLLVLFMVSTGTLSFNVFAQVSDKTTDNIISGSGITRISLNEEGDGSDDPSGSSEIIPDTDTDSYTWDSSAYYIREADLYDVTKTDDFHLSYQIEFHTDTDIPAYSVKIRVPAELLTDRYGKIYLANDIAVPEASVVDEDFDENGLLINADYQPSKTIGFNYYIEEDKTTHEKFYVFFNYKDLTVGTSAAFQVLYKNLEILDLVDNTTWDLPVTYDVYLRDTDNNKVYHQSLPTTHLTGKIDSHVNLTSVTKKAYEHGEKSYTPALYTKRQVNEYVSWRDPQNYEAIINGKRQVENPDGTTKTVDVFNDYRYAVWETSIKVSDSTQPFYVVLDEKEFLRVDDTTGENIYSNKHAEVIGFSSGNTNQPIGVYKTVDGKYIIWDKNGLIDKATEDGGNSYYHKEKNLTFTNVRIVVAYPRDKFDTDYPPVDTSTETSWPVTNNLKASIIPVDGKGAMDPIEFKSTDATFNYKEYKYIHSPDGFSSSKGNGGSYNGWTNSWYTKSKRELSDGDKPETKDLGGIPFSVSGSSSYYTHTHYIAPEGTYSAGDIKDKEHKFVRLTVVDDMLYLSSGKDGMVRTDSKSEPDEEIVLEEGLRTEGKTYVNLKRGDYYYESVVATIGSTSYDVYEDTSMDAALDLDFINKEISIYAMFEMDEDGNPYVNTGDNPDPEIWEKVVEKTASDTTKLEYTFPANLIARHPYRVMAICESNAHTQSANFKLSVALKGDSITVKDYIVDAFGGNDNVLSVTLENNMGIQGTVITYDSSGNVIESKDKISNDESSSTSAKWKTPVNSAGEPYIDIDTEKKGLYKTTTNGNPHVVTPIRFQDWRYNDSPNTQGFAYLNAANPFARTNKTADMENDPANNRINVKYNLVAYSGYEVYNQTVVNYMNESGNKYTGHNKVVFYDLLPLGVEFDPSVPVVAGRLTDVDEKQIFKYPDSWDKKNIKVTVDPEKDVITNFNGSGQTLVMFHVEYTGSDPTFYKTGRDLKNNFRNLWVEGYGISYGAYYTWENVMMVESNDSYNVFAFTTDKGLTEPNETNIVGKVEGSATPKAELEAYVYENADHVNKTVSYPTGEEALYAPLFAVSEGRDIWSSNPDFKEVIYGKVHVRDIYARGSQAEIFKGVRADSDGFASFTDEAEVKVGEGYTYEIIVKTSSNPLEEIIVYDQIEYSLDAKTQSGIPYTEAVADNPSQKDKTFDENSWYGTFTGINKKTLLLQGVLPVVYYSIYRGATVPAISEEFDDIAITSSTLPSDLSSLTGDELKTGLKSYMEKGYYTATPTGNEKPMWVEETLFTESGFKLPEVKAYAVDMRKGKNKDTGAIEDFVLPDMSSVSYYFSMRSPSEMMNTTKESKLKRISGEPAEWAYNNAAYSAKFDIPAGEDHVVLKDSDLKSLLSNSTRVRQIDNDSLVIEKHVNNMDSVPENFSNQEFTFTVNYRLETSYTKDGVVYETPFKPFANKYYDIYELKGTEWVKVNDKVQATDVDGKFKLKDNQKAVFKTPILDEDKALVEENGSLYYEVIEEDSPFWKKEVEYSFDNTTNDFTEVTYNFENTFRPFLYVSKAVSEYGTLDISNLKFSFTLYEKDGDEYVPAPGVEFWKVSNAYADATIPSRILEKVNGRDKYVTYTTGDPTDTVDPRPAGTFEIGANETVCMFAGLEGHEYKVVENISEDSDWVLLTEKEVTGTLGIVNNIVNFKNRYKLRDLYITKELTHYPFNTCNDAFSFKVVELKENGTAGDTEEVALYKPVSDTDDTNSYRYYILNNKKEIAAGDLGTPLNNDGTFTAAIGGKSVLIKGLEYGKTYLIYELVAEDGTSLINGKNSEYRPLSQISEAKMPIYSMSKEVSFTNDYLLRPLSVTKTVVAKSSTVDTTDYTMRVSVDRKDGKGYVPLSNYEYKNSANSTVTTLPETTAEGTFTIKGSETVTFEAVARQGSSYRVEELWNGGYVQIYPTQKTDDDGNPVRNDDGTLLEQGTDYQAPLDGVFEKEGAGATIINGEKGVLLIGKEYVTDSADSEDPANKYIASLKTAIASGTASNEAVTLTLTVKPEKGAEYIWPETNRNNVKLFNLITGGLPTDITLEAGKPITLEPWERILVDDLDPDTKYTYTLSESDSDTLKMYDASKVLPGETGYINIKAIEESVNGDLELSPLATIYNKVTSYSPKSSIMKYMKPGSDPIVEGEGIYFRVEEYNAASKSWAPKEGIRYIVTEYDANIDETYISNPLLEEDLFFYDEDILTTGSDGKISYYKESKLLNPEDTETVSLYPRINFIDNVVYLSLENTSKTDWADKDLRLVELMNEADDSWGQWYTNEQTYDSANNTVNAYVANSNRSVKMDLRKQLLEDEIDDGRSYTFILKQVTKYHTASGNIVPDESVPGAGVPYEVLNKDGTSAGTFKTGADGKIKLTVDQTARILFADETVWTFEEVQDSVYRLAEDVDVVNGQKINPNLALVGAKAEVIPVMLKATPSYIYALVNSGIPSNDFIVDVYYSDGTHHEIVLKVGESLGYIKTFNENTDHSWNVHFEYTEKGVTVATDCKLLPKPAPSFVRDFNYEGHYEEFIAPKSGYYLLEAWGAQGGDAPTSSFTYPGGSGAYASGMIYLEEGEKLYVTVGQQGSTNAANSAKVIVPGGYNGGGDAYSNQAGGASRTGSGGGATSITKELVGTGLLKDYVSNKDLVLMVAGGGGGANYWPGNGGQYGYGGHGGGVEGLTGFNHPYHSPGTGGTQTAGGKTDRTNPGSGHVAGSFGQGGSNIGLSVGSAGGGGGYYGGGASYDNAAGGGGSGYINGYDSCNQANKNNNYLITDGKFIMGGQEMMLPGGTSGLGNRGDGHARITLIEEKATTFNYTGSVQSFTASRSGFYKFEAWGAQGSSKYEEGGHGGYTSGYIFLENGETVFVYVGNTSDYLENAFNGGIAGSTRANVSVYTSSGGGATDFRLASDSSDAGNWNDFNSLKSRIMVAAGGGGSCKYSANTPGGYAGGLTAGPNYFSNWVDQPRGVVTSTNGTADQHGGLKAFNDPETHDGKVRNPVESIFGSGNGSGSGGGYYGGVYYGISARVYSGGGGSSYVSGYPGCISIAASSSLGHIVESGSASHYSGRIFIEPVIKSGNEIITEPDGTTSKGHKGNGVARITYIGDSMDYIFLEYLESDGSRGNYIDLGFNMLTADYNDYKYDVTFSISDSQNSNSVWHTVLEPEYIDEDTAIYRILFGNSNNLLLYSNGRAGGGWTHNTVLTPFEKYNVILDVEDGQMKNTLTKLSDNSSSTLTRGISTQKKDENNLFAFANTPTSDTTLSGKIFGIKVYKNDKLIHDFIPSKNTLLNKYGFYDNVSNLMHYANGTIKGN